ncbi:hypothetical protein EP331_10215, partial [bacterium]
SGNPPIAPFVLDQIDLLKKNDELIVMPYAIKGKGIVGYLLSYLKFKGFLKTFKPQIIHAHFGYSGFFANIQRKIPVITTFHGSDIHNSRKRKLSMIALKLSKHVIYVSKYLNKFVDFEKYKSSYLPCGVSTDIFKPLDKKQCRENLGLDVNKYYVLFSSSFHRPEKNSKLAIDAIDLLNKSGIDIQLIEFDGIKRENVPLLMNAVDVGLLTSLNEGSPQFTKECISCETPIVSVEVGDVRDQFNNCNFAYLAEYSIESVAENIKKAVSVSSHLKKQSNLDFYSNNRIISETIQIYKKVLNEK